MRFNGKLLIFLLFISYAHAQGISPNGGGAPTGAAGGDLTGTYPNPGVAKISGTTPGTGIVTAIGNALNAVGGLLGVGANAGGDLSGTLPNPTVAKVNGTIPGGTCTNQFARSLSSSAVPTCASIANADMPAYATLGATNAGNPTGTGATGGVMMGIGSSCVITPAVSGKVLVSFTFGHANALAAVTDTLQVKYGTGTAPSNGSGTTGTSLGNQLVMFEPTGTATNQISATFIVIGLTLSATWFDFLLASGSAGNIASVSSVTCSIKELP